MKEFSRSKGDSFKASNGYTIRDKSYIIHTFAEGGETAMVLEFIIMTGLVMKMSLKNNHRPNCHVGISQILPKIVQG